ncbi:MAG: hypothetical protein LLG37_01645 [Spirochaetia bacterium]|nr:hypothetical protein [Spirochaetia bacterium]
MIKNIPTAAEILDMLKPGGRIPEIVEGAFREVLSVDEKGCYIQTDISNTSPKRITREMIAHVAEVLRSKGEYNTRDFKSRLPVEYGRADASTPAHAVFL